MIEGHRARPLVLLLDLEHLVEALHRGFPLLQPSLGLPLEVPAAGHRTVTRQSRIEGGDGLAPAIQAAETEPTVVVHARLIEAQCDRLVAVGERLLESPETVERVASVRPRPAELRIEGRGRIERGQRLVATAERLQQSPSIAEVSGHLRL